MFGGSEGMIHWLAGTTRSIATGRVVRYRTHERHEQDGWIFHADRASFATRSPSGELCVLFFQNLPDGDVGRALWLPSHYGLCGVEPGVLNPQLRNMAMVNEAVRQSDARVFRELRQEAESARRARGEREDSISVEIRRQASEELASIADREAAGSIEEDLRGQREIVLDSGVQVKASWEVVQARVEAVKKKRKSPRKSPEKAPGKKARRKEK